MLFEHNETAKLHENNIPLRFLNAFGFINYNSDGSVPWTTTDNISLSEEYTSVTEFLGIDCEMVGVGNFKTSALGRVSIVNVFGFCVYDTFVNPLEEVTCYNTQFSGIRAEDLIGAPPIDLVLEKVADIVRGRILVGHSIHNDLEVLKLNHPSVAIRDTANYFQHNSGSKRTPALRNLIKHFFNDTIQDGEHSSIQDAQATLRLYLLVKEEWEKDASERRKKANLSDTVTDIMCMHVQPRRADLFTESESIFIRPNKVAGAYYSSEEYKDIHFRLLIEDFLRPLRQDLRVFKQRRMHQNNHFRNIRIAADNSLEEPDFEVKSSKTLLVPMRGNQLEEIDWDDRNIFLNGSLLILSPDNFHTIKCAKVIDIGTPRENSNILHLFVNFLLDGPSWKITDKDRFEMIESQAFFLPYEYTLNFLQDVDLDKFPMKKYIVDAITTSDVASHLLKQPNNQIDFLVLTENSQRVVQARPLEYHNWPSAAELNLDQSQFEGLQKALTQELTIIQGPPGTGKSHVSLQIIKMLLTNKWLSPSPILIVSYTNHALDELLEPVLNFLTNEIHDGDSKKSEQSLLRIGGGCESTAILRCTLKFKKEMCKEKSKNKKLVKSLEKALLKVHGLDFASRLVHHGIIDFKLVPQLLLAKLETNESTKDIFKAWNKSYRQISGNVLDWFGLSEQSVEPTPISLRSIRDGMFILLCRNLEAILTENFTRIPTTLEELQGKSLHSTNHMDNQHFVTRWGFYFFLVDHLAEVIQTTSEELRLANILSKELDHYVKENQILKNAKVIGMTTTGAVKYKELVEKKFKSNIMIVEEAAHVLEAHVVASLTQHCTQLILIGDHKQLRPMIADHNLKDSFLDVSLMERLVQNGIAQDNRNWTQLKVQHRMRAEIAELICPVIYNELENHSDVELYPAVMGCAKNLFFVQHEHPESRETCSKSRFNDHEAKYIIGLMSYFIECGYLPAQITVICTYLAQKTLIENTIKDEPTINQIQISTVDGYQGKQNDLIILSLVRNNSNDNVGFLDTDNRVCVALSRARHGLIMIGNMRILAACSETWSKINKILMERHSIGADLPLTRPTLFKLHDNLIHSTDKLPSLAVRNVPTRTRRPRHRYQRKSETNHNLITKTGAAPSQLSEIHKNTALACGHIVSASSSSNPIGFICKTKVREQLPCGHVRHIPCNERSRAPKCHAVMQKTMPCHHIVKTACHRLSSATCMADVKKIFSCGHRVTVPCQQILCPKKIIQQLPCGHEKEVVCSEMGDKFKCTAIVKHTLPCGKEESRPCHMLPSTVRVLSCGHLAQSTTTNSSKCSIKVREQLPCGHVRNIPCNEKLNRPKCGALVKKTLKCGHTMDTACHKLSIVSLCVVNVKRTLPCGHQSIGPCYTLSAKEAKCENKTEKKLSCGHLVNISCGVAVAKYKCDVEVEETPKCGHVRRVLCSEAGKKTTKCVALVQKKMKCGHTIAVACHLFPTAPCYMEITKTLSCGHAERILCKDRKCDKRCSSVVKYKYPCGHTHVFPCGVEVAKKCNWNINRKLPCGHTQSSSCHQNPISIKCKHLVTIGRVKYECHSLLDVIRELQDAFNNLHLNQ